MEGRLETSGIFLESCVRFLRIYLNFKCPLHMSPKLNVKYMLLEGSFDGALKIVEWNQVTRVQYEKGNYVALTPSSSSSSP